jgi:cholest-4-en-3-one 26-monooxygenase
MPQPDLLPDLLNAATFRDGPPHALFDHLRKTDPVYGQPDPINGVTAWSLTRFADLRAVSGDVATFSIARGHQYPTPRAYAAAMGNNIMFNDPPRHTRLRSFGAKAFSPSVVTRFDGWIREICVSIVDSVARQDTIDMVPMIAAELPGQVIASIMGVPDADRRNLIGWASQIFGRLDPEVGLEVAMQAVSFAPKSAASLQST